MTKVILSFVLLPVSNFVSYCQTIKPVRKLIDVNWKPPHERLSVVNIFMMSIHFYELVLSFFLYFILNFAITMLTSFFKGYVRCNNFSTNEFLMSNNFI